MNMALSNDGLEDRVEVRVLFWGRLAEIFGRERRLSLPAEGCPLGEIRRRLAASGGEPDPELMRADVRGSVDQVICPDSAWVRGGSEVAFLPVFSGG